MTRNTRFFAAFASVLAITCSAVSPEVVYDGGFGKGGSYTIRILIMNRGASQSGLIKELADAYTTDRIADGCDSFRIAWVKSDTICCIQHLKGGDSDAGIT
ncbi:Fc.00g073660.m01.CDS01 [Cosmosporella sp. VM-42]